MEIVEKIFEVFGKIYKLAEQAKANTSNCKKAATRCRGVESIINNCVKEYKRYNGLTVSVASKLPMHIMSLVRTRAMT